MNPETLDRLKQDLDASLPAKRRRHVYQVAEEAKALCRVHGADEEKAELAALCHDRYRALSQEEADALVREYALGEKYLGNRNLSHSKIAAILVQKEYGIDDPDVLNAISFHTTGREDMSLLEKIIFLADSIEPDRAYPGIQRIRRTAYKDIDKACFLSMDNSIRFVEEKGEFVDNETVVAREAFSRILKERKAKEKKV